MLHLQADTLSFLAKNNFDFNKLFRSAINYSRKCDHDQLYEKCVFKVGKYYPDNRNHEALSTAHEAELDLHMSKVNDWVYDPTSEKKLKFTVNSLGLRKYLDKKINGAYRGKGVYYSWNRKSAEVSVEKNKKFVQSDFLKGVEKKVVPTKDEMNA